MRDGITATPHDRLIAVKPRSLPTARRDAFGKHRDSDRANCINTRMDDQSIEADPMSLPSQIQSDRQRAYS